MNCVVLGLKAPHMIARGEAPGTQSHKLSQGLKGRPNSSPIIPNHVPPLQGGGKCEANVFPGLHPGLLHNGLSALPKLRGPSGRAPSDSEKATLQNAVTATDQQIDALVYDLYGLTEDEIKLVEGNA